MQKPLRVITQDFELVTEIDTYESMIVTRKWHDIGELDVKINRHTDGADLLSKGTILMVGGDLNKAFIIKHREIELDENGKESEVWTIKAPSLKSILSQRITIPPDGVAYDKIEDTADKVMRHYVESNVSNPVDPDRVIPNVFIDTTVVTQDTLSWSSRYKDVSQEMVEMSKLTGLGWNLKLDFQQKKWAFVVEKGRDLTVNQTSNPPVIFSPEFDSLQSISYSESDLNYKNVAIVAGPNEGVDRIVTNVGSAAGVNRHEAFIDARDIQDETENGETIPLSEVEAELTDRGEKKLSELQQEKYLNGQVLTKSPFLYEVDYDLGDIVTIQNKNWGVTMNARITEMKEIYERAGFKIEATFGNDRPTLISKIKEGFEQLSPEIRK